MILAGVQIKYVPMQIVETNNNLARARLSVSG